jgi:hypothetical protein
MSEHKRIAAIVTTFFPNSHAGVLAGKFLTGFATDEGLIAPRTRVASLYMDQVHDRDVGLQLAEAYDIPVFGSIRAALTLGGSELGVDAVLLIGEHGDYPWNERERHLYPRRQFFEQIAGVFAESGRSVPVFNDKHFSYDFRDARWMWNRALELDIPLMAGSSLPLCWRNPWLEYDKGTVVEEALSIGYGGIEAYGFHALETLQCMIERRRGGESGVTSVQCLEGEEVWRSRDRGEWSGALAEAACAPIRKKPEGSMEEHAKEPAVFLVEYADGLKTATLMLNGYVSDFAYAGRVDGEIQGVEFFLQNDGPFAHFSYLCVNVQNFMRTGVAPYPPERTLLTTGIIDAAMNSRFEGHRVVETPDLAIIYESWEEPPVRPIGTRPIGTSVDPKAADIV